MIREISYFVFLFTLIGCTSRPLRHSDDCTDFAETSKRLRNATIYFRDSTYATASSIETDGHMLYWVDSATKTVQEDLLQQVEKIVFYDRRMDERVGLGGLIGTIIVSILISSDSKPVYEWEPSNIFGYAGLALMGLSMTTGGVIGGTIAYMAPVPITYTVSDSLR